MKVDVNVPSANLSSREGGRPKLVVLHTTEGFDRTTDDLSALKDLGYFFQKSSTVASSHIANDRFGNDARYVPDESKAWTQCNLNPVSLSIEQIGYSSFSTEEWMKKRTHQLTNTATWIAGWSAKYGIAIQHGKVSGTTVTRNGVVQHKDLGQDGCGHSDCGSGYPTKYVIVLARLIYEEHFNKHTNKRKANRLRKKVNRMRKKYGIYKLAEPK